MRVQVLHDRYILLEVASGLDPTVHVRVDKQHVTAMGKGVASSWSADSATVNLSSDPLVDVVLYSTSPHQHRVVVSSVVDESTLQALHQVVLDGRHMASTVLSDEHCVLGAEAITKHLITKHIGILALRCPPQVMHSYSEEGECEARFQRALMRTELARQHRGASACRVKTVGSQAFRLFQRFNTTSTSKITSAFPENSLAFGVSTRNETPMYMVFDRQRNAVLVADVAMHLCEVVGGGVQMFERSTNEQVVADMHFVNVSTVYHPQLLPRRELLLKKACKSVDKPSQYTASILQMFRFEEGPMLALLAQQDL